MAAGNTATSHLPRSSCVRHTAAAVTRPREPAAGTVPESAQASPLEAILATPLGEPVESYAEPLPEEQVREIEDKLDALEPAHTAAAAKLRELFAG